MVENIETAVHSAGGQDAIVTGVTVVVAREAPLHLGHLRALLALAEMGAVILPPLPAFYPRPRTIDDVVDHTVGRALDQLGVPHALVQEWTGTARARRPSPPRTGG